MRFYPTKDSGTIRDNPVNWNRTLSLLLTRDFMSVKRSSISPNLTLPIVMNSFMTGRYLNIRGKMSCYRLKKRS